MLRVRVHVVAGSLALATILVFWAATVVSLLSGNPAFIQAAKAFVLFGMGLLVPALVAVGVTGNLLGRGWKSPIVARKRIRMIVITANGALLLLPCAIFLALRQPAGIDAAYVLAQSVELISGAINISLLSLNMRDGLALRRPRRSTVRPVTAP